MAFNEKIKVYTSNALCLIPGKNSTKFEEMVHSLNAFHSHQSGLMDQESKFKYPLLTRSIYNNLEKLLIEIAYLTTTSEERLKKIEEVYKWYINSIDDIPRLNKLTYKTYDNLVDSTFLTANIEQEKFPFNELNMHRSNALDEFNPNDKIDSIFRRHCFNKATNNDNKELSKTNLGMNDSLIINNSKEFQSLYLASLSHNGKKFKSISQRKPRIKHCHDLFTIKEKEINKYEKIKKSSWYLKQQKALLVEKNRIVKNKRYIEEVKAILNEFGLSKAKLNETQIKNGDIKNIIEQYSIKKHNQANNSRKNDNDDTKNNCNKTNKTFEIMQKSDKISSNKAHIKASLRNSISNKRMKCMDLKVNKMNKNHSTSSFFNFSHNQKTLKSDMVAIGIANNPIFHARLINKSLLNINEISQVKNDINDNTTKPISAYDLMNHRDDSKTPCSSSNNNVDYIRTSSDFIKKEFTRSASFLELRKTMEIFKKYELSSLSNTLKKNKRKVDPKLLSTSLLHPKTCNINPVNYLPQAGFGLLSNRSLIINPTHKKKKNNS